jgi:predicted dehydrogenase
MTRRQFLSSAAAATLASTALSQVPAASKRWRVGIIGHTGRGDYGHGVHTVWLGIPETEIVGLADADPKGLEKARHALNSPPGFADYRAMLAETKPEIVAVCPRHVDQHRDMIVAAIEAGAKGIYVEKPFCRTPAEADEIVAACDKSGVKLAVAHRNRFHPALKEVRAAMDDGTLGQLLEIRGRGKEDTRGGGLDLWVLGSHLMNLFHWAAGKPLTCSAEIYVDKRLATPADVTQGAEGVGPIVGNRIHARYEMESGIPAYFDSIKSAGVAAANFGIQLIGTKGIIDLRIDVEPLAHFVPGNPHMPTATPRPWIPITSAGVGKPEPIVDLKRDSANHAVAVRDLLAAIQEGRQSLCSAADGRVTVEMICAVFASHVRGGAPVPLPLMERGNSLVGWA